LGWKFLHFFARKRRCRGVACCSSPVLDETVMPLVRQPAGTKPASGTFACWFRCVRVGLLLIALA